MKNALFALGLGLLVTLVTLLVPYAYCYNGDARGFPLAAIIPACESGPVQFGRGRLPGIQVVDALRVAGDVLIWGGMAFGLLGYLDRRREAREELVVETRPEGGMQ